MAKIPGVKNLFATVDGEFLILKTRFEKFTDETKAGNPKVCGTRFVKLDKIEGLELPPGYTLMIQLIYKAPVEEVDDEDEAPVSKKPTSKKAAVTAPAKTTKKAAVTAPAPAKKTGKVTKPAAAEADEEQYDEEQNYDEEVTSPVMPRRTRRAA